jgi:hypothetical protein
MPQRENEVGHMRSSSESNLRSFEEAESALRAAVRKLQSNPTIQFSTHRTFGGQEFAGYPGNNKAAKDISQSRNDRLPDQYFPVLTLNGETRHRRCSSASKKSIPEKGLSGPDYRIDPRFGKTLFHYEDLQLDEDEFARPISPFELVRLYKSESSFYTINSDDLECSTVSQLADSSLQCLPSDSSLATENSLGPGVRLRGGLLSSIEF